MRFPTFLQRYGPRPSFTERSEASQIRLRVVPLYHRRRIVMLIGRSVFPSPCGRSPRADEVMAFGRRTVTMSFSGLRLIFTIGGLCGPVCCFSKPRGLCGAPEDGLAETVCGSYEPRGPQPPHAEARHFADAPCGHSAGCHPPSQTASFPHFGCAAAAPVRQNARKLAFAHDFS